MIYHFRAIIHGMTSKRIPLGELGDLRQGLTLSRYLDPVGPSRRILQVTNLSGTQVVAQPDDRTETMDASRIKDHEAQPGQVLISLRGSSLKAAVVPKRFPPAVISNSLVIFDLEPELADPYFIAGLLNSAAMQRRVANLFTGVTIQGIPLSRFKQIEILLPPLEVQQRYATAYQALEAYRAAALELISLRDDQLEAHLQGYIIKEKA